jgi:hypothetical protein
VNAVIRPRARDDIIRQFRWYLVEQDKADVANRFLDAFEESVRWLLSNDDYRRAQDFRVCDILRLIPKGAFP